VGIAWVIPGDKSGDEFKSACGAGGDEPVPEDAWPVVGDEELFLRAAVVGEGAWMIGDEDQEDISSSIMVESYSTRALPRPTSILQSGCKKMSAGK